MSGNFNALKAEKMTDRTVKRTKQPATPQVPGRERRWLVDGPLTRPVHLIFAHGAGAPMTSPFLDRIAALLNSAQLTVHRFEFPYMAERSAGGRRRPAPRAETMVADYVDALSECRSRIGSKARLYIGGKSMGGRIACLAALQQELPEIAGVVVIGFPLTPPAKPQATRGAILEALTHPTLIVQGTRDTFGGRDAFQSLRLPRCVQLHFIEDGDHDLRPRKASGRTHDEALQEATRTIAAFCAAEDDRDGQMR
jgi:predicted alpha/beta-hydrolase family hydrolase